MGNQGLEKNRRQSKSKSSKMAKDDGRMSLSEVKKILESKNKKEIIKFLKSHDQVKTKLELDDGFPELAIGELVWAKNYGCVYWPAFITKVEDRNDLKPTDLDGGTPVDPKSYTAVMFLEESYRFALLPWDQVIPFRDYELQKLMLPQFNKLVVKRNWKKSSSHQRFKKALELVDEFLKIPPLQRREAAENKFKIERTNNQKKRESLANKSAVSNKEPEPEGPEVDQQISKTVSEAKKKKKQGIRVSDRLLQERVVQLKEKKKSKKISQKTEKPVEATTAAKPTKLKLNGRPDVGGEALRKWTDWRFSGMQKQYTFDTSKPVMCQTCNKGFKENEEMKSCHGLPHHANCLTGAIAGKDGESTLKCSMCIEKLCFLCKKVSEKKVALKCTRCDLRFHIDCLSSEWPQAEIQGSTGPITCPLHYCHTCMAEQKIFGKFRDYTAPPSKSFRCLLCLSTYHKGCLPAGCGEDIQGKDFIICPRHKLPDLKVQQRRIGCLACYKALKPKEENRVDCSYCIQCFHPACIGYTGDICEKVSLQDFGNGYKCFSCKWGFFPLYGQVVWYQQPQSQFWPARILFPQESKARSERYKRLPGEYSVEYFGGASYYDHANRAVPLHLTTMNIFKVMKVYQDTPKILRAHEEAAFFLLCVEKHRDSSLQKPKPIYKKIERNAYRTLSVPKVKEASEICSCAESDKTSEFVCVADSGCTNRDMEMECSDRICKGGVRCANRMFVGRKNDDEFLQQKLFPSKGWGVVAKKEFSPGDFVSEYRGEVIDGTEKLWRLNKKEEEDPTYILEISKELYIDAEYIGNVSRLINHSCDPNSEVRKYLSNGRHVGGIFARRKIEVGEEVTFKYGYGSQSTAPFKCRCGSSKCLVFVGKAVPEGYQADDDDKDVDMENWDDVCSKCGYGGRVICCEYPGCGKVWHMACIGLSRPPKKNWWCNDHKRKPVGSGKKRPSSSNGSRRARPIGGGARSAKTKPTKTDATSQVLSIPLPKRRSNKLSTASSTPTSTKSKSPKPQAEPTPTPSKKRKASTDLRENVPPLKKLTTTAEDSTPSLPNQVTTSASRRRLRSSKGSNSDGGQLQISVCNSLDISKHKVFEP